MARVSTLRQQVVHKVTDAIAAQAEAMRPVLRAGDLSLSAVSTTPGAPWPNSPGITSQPYPSRLNQGIHATAAVSPLATDMQARRTGGVPWTSTRRHPPPPCTSTRRYSSPWTNSLPSSKLLARFIARCELHSSCTSCATSESCLNTARDNHELLVVSANPTSNTLLPVPYGEPTPQGAHGGGVQAADQRPARC